MADTFFWNNVSRLKKKQVLIRLEPKDLCRPRHFCYLHAKLARNAKKLNILWNKVEMSPDVQMVLRTKMFMEKNFWMKIEFRFYDLTITQEFFCQKGPRNFTFSKSYFWKWQEWQETRMAEWQKNGRRTTRKWLKNVFWDFLTPLSWLDAPDIIIFSCQMTNYLMKYKNSVFFVRCVPTR